MLIDTHSHLNFHEYDQDREQVVRRSLDNDIWLINVGANLASSQRAVEYLKQYPQGVFASVGLHPEHLTNQVFEIEGKKTIVKKEEFNQDKYKKLAKSSDKVVAIGETGLDYYRLEGNQEEIKNNQKKVFEQHLILASPPAGGLNLPVIFHCREAHQEMIEILKRYEIKGGIAHSFTGGEEDLQEYLAMGFYISYNGIITFNKKAEALQALVKITPLDKILLETDCPYLTPEPHRGQRNEPSYVKYVAEKVAELKNISVEEVEVITTANARKLFKI
ncbi:MAG: TatD family hydrolase [bacterium]